MSGISDTPRCYAVRRVNPFEGVLQVVEMPNARAYSPNGRVWQIQVLARRPDHTWRSTGDSAAIEQFFNFGLWDAAQGLHRIPANPVMDIGAMSRAADTLAAALITQRAQLPFPLIDRYECWATGDDGAPVALLATTDRADDAAARRVDHWRATQPMDHGFVSQTLVDAGMPAQDPLGPRQHAEQLESEVSRIGPNAIWFLRDADGHGTPLGAGHDADVLANDAFPSLGLKRDWRDPRLGGLVDDYIGWIAARLLLLQHLDDAERAWLEQRALHRAVELAEYHKLIPRIIDRAKIEAARVEARIRCASV